MTRPGTGLASPHSSYAGVRNPRVDWLRALLRHTTQFCDDDDRDSIIGAVCQASGGSAEGLKVADEWYRRRSDYPGAMQLLFKWKSLQQEQTCLDGFAVLCDIVEGYGFDWMDACDATEPGFETCAQMVVVEPANQLTRYSLAGQLAVLERDAVEQVSILGGLALMGQSTNLYSSPNLGKTLLAIWLLIATILQGLIKPERLFYVNVDDSLSGLIEKLRLAEEFGFHMLAEGYRDFKASDLVSLLNTMIDKDECHGVVIVLDVLKKFTDLMSKRKSSGFGNVIRRFVIKGGTCISLAHTNKRPGTDGRPVYGGTSDSLEDVDAAHVMQVISEPDAREKIVAFECIKRRGNVRQRAFYGYSAEEGISYEELLASVRPIAETEQIAIRRAEDFKTDAELMCIARTCIQEGIVTKMLLAGTIAGRSGCSKRTAIKLLEKYTGTDAGSHAWTFEVKARGAKTFRLLAISEADSEQKI